VKTTRFVPNGLARFQASESFQAQCREIRAQVRLQFCAQLANAGFFRRLFIRWQMHRAFQRAVAEITPSSQSLWIAGANIANKLNARSEKSARQLSD
jgi:hypothetical protein